jgi:hypothetical protein
MNLHKEQNFFLKVSCFEIQNFKLFKQIHMEKFDV